MKTSRDFNREYKKYGMSIKFRGTKWHNGSYCKWWEISYTDNKGYIQQEGVYSMYEAEDTAEWLINRGYVKELNKK